MNSGDPGRDETLQAVTPTDQSFYENAADIIAVVDVDFKLTNVNRRFEEELGMRREELLGRPVASVMTPESVEHARAHVRELFDGKSQAMFEITVHRADGEAVPFEVNAVPIRQDGTIRAIEASLRNISERRKRDEALRTSEETIRVLLNAASSAVFLIDARGIVLAANQATRDRMGQGELVGRPIAEFLPPEVAERRRQKGLEVIRTGRPLEFEDECLGRSYWTSIHPIHDESGAIIRLAIYSRDITDDKQAAEERKRLTLQLQQAQKMEAIGTLAGGIAHDFNNLLMAIQGNVSLVLFDLEPSDQRHRLLTNIEKLVGSGAELTAKLLGYARRGKYESRPLRPNDLVRETAETFSRMRKDIRIHCDLADGLKPIIADRGQLEQVLLNLFVNAADAMPNGGQLLLETRNATPRHPCQRVHGQPRRLRAPIGARHGRRDGLRDHGAHLRPVLHHKADGARHRSRPRFGLRDRQGARRLHRRGVGNGRGGSVSSTCPRPTSRPRPRPRPALRPSPAPARSCWSTTSSRCSR